MKKNLRWLVLVVAFTGMGVGMPSCPGQQAMQQQLDALQNANTELTKKIAALNGQIGAINNDMTQVKQLLPQMTNVITTQKTRLDSLEAQVAEMAKAKAAPSRGGAKKRR